MEGGGALITMASEKKIQVSTEVVVKYTFFIGLNFGEEVVEAIAVTTTTNVAKIGLGVSNIGISSLIGTEITSFFFK